MAAAFSRSPVLPTAPPRTGRYRWFSHSSLWRAASGPNRRRFPTRMASLFFSPTPARKSGPLVGPTGFWLGNIVSEPARNRPRYPFVVECSGRFYLNPDWLRRPKRPHGDTLQPGEDQSGPFRFRTSSRARDLAGLERHPHYPSSSRAQVHGPAMPNCNRVAV